MSTHAHGQIITAPSGAADAEDFGDTVMVRTSHSWANYAIMAIAAVATVVGMLAIMDWSQHTAKSVAEAVRLVIFDLGLLAVAGVCSPWAGMNTFEFRRRGVTKTRLGRRRAVLAYAEIDQMSFGVTRMYHHGVYIGTHMRIDLVGVSGRVRYVGRYKEKMNFLGNRQKEPDFEAETLRGIITDAAAQRLEQRFTQTASSSWGDAAAITPQGLIPRHGKYKAQCVPFENISGTSIANGWMHIFAHGDRRPFMQISLGSVNFWSGLEIVTRLCELVQREQAQTKDQSRAAADAAA